MKTYNIYCQDDCGTVIHCGNVAAESPESAVLAACEEYRMELIFLRAALPGQQVSFDEQASDDLGDDDFDWSSIQFDTSCP